MSVDKRARQHFDSLSQSEKRQAIYRMADEGYSDYSVAAATELAVEQIRQVLAQRRARATG